MWPREKEKVYVLTVVISVSCLILACVHPSVKSGATDAKKEYEKAKKKYQVLLKKQETLLRGEFLVP